MDAFFIFGAKYLFLLAPVVALWVFWFLPRSEKKRFVVMLAAVCVAAIIIAKIAGAIYYDPQPFVVGNFIPLIEHSIDNGFPSDHTLFVAAISAVVWYFNRRAGLWLFLLAIVVGLSRVYVGVHHIIDIVAAILISYIVAWIVGKFFKKREMPGN